MRHESVDHFLNYNLESTKDQFGISGQFCHNFENKKQISMLRSVIHDKNYSKNRQFGPRLKFWPPSQA